MAVDNDCQELETPILDSGVLPDRVRKRTGTPTIIGVIVGFFFGIIMIEVVGVQASGDLDNAFGWLVFGSALLFSVTVQEFGHLSAGWLQGFRFSLISVGPFCLRVEHGRFKISLHREMTALGYAGMHIDRVRRLRHRLVLYALAGPLAGLLLVPFAVFFANHSTFARTHPWALSFSAEFVMVSILLSTMSLIPMGKISTNDGSGIALLLRDVQRARRLLSVAAISSQHEKGVRPRNWKRTWLKGACSTLDDSSEDLGGNWLAYISCADRHDTLMAGLHLEKCLRSSRLFGLGIRDLVAQESAVFSAWFRGNPLLADKWLGQVKRPELIQPLQRIRIDIAICSGRSDFKAGLERWEEAFDYIEKLPARPVRESLKELWLEWRKEMEERQNAMTTA